MGKWKSEGKGVEARHSLEGNAPGGPEGYAAFASLVLVIRVPAVN